jgi:ABC-type phosphate/phosphonate transport system ATPase subunit
MYFKVWLSILTMGIIDVQPGSCGIERSRLFNLSGAERQAEKRRVGTIAMQANTVKRIGIFQ